MWCIRKKCSTIVYGSRNPAADNYNPDAIYDDDSSEFSFDTNPKKIGTLSQESCGNGMEMSGLQML